MKTCPTSARCHIQTTASSQTTSTAKTGSKLFTLISLHQPALHPGLVPSTATSMPSPPTRSAVSCILFPKSKSGAFKAPIVLTTRSSTRHSIRASKHHRRPQTPRSHNSPRYLIASIQPQMKTCHRLQLLLHQYLPQRRKSTTSNLPATATTQSASNVLASYIPSHPNTASQAGSASHS